MGKKYNVDTVQLYRLLAIETPQVKGPWIRSRRFTLEVPLRRGDPALRHFIRGSATQLHLHPFARVTQNLADRVLDGDAPGERKAVWDVEISAPLWFGFNYD